MSEVVTYFEYKKKEGETYYEKVKAGEAVFMGFGLDYEELEMGVGTYSVAILKLSDGSVKTVEASLIKFK